MRCIQAERRLTYVHLRQEARHRGCKPRPLGISSIGWRHPIGMCPALCCSCQSTLLQCCTELAGILHDSIILKYCSPCCHQFCVQASVCSIRDVSILMLRLWTPKNIFGKVATKDSTIWVRSLTEVSINPELSTSMGDPHALSS